MEDVRIYSIYDRGTGHVVAHINTDGTLSEEGNPQAIAQLKELLQQELVVRDRQLGYAAEDEDEGYELFPDGSMCYFGLVTLRPSDPEYLPTFLRILPSISPFEVRAVQQ